MLALRPSSVCAAGIAVALLAGACSVDPPSGPGPTMTPAGSPSVTRAGDGATPRTVEAEAAPQAGEASSPATGAGAVTDADISAGVLQAHVPEVGAGEFTTAAGSTPAPQASARTRTVTVQVEDGLPVDAGAAADFVMDTLNDPRGWSTEGYSFARGQDVDEADIVIVLASPQTSAAMCRPLITGGKLSCREGRRAIITWYRWVHGHRDYGTDRTGYRQYVINHEVGHVLGRGHVSCPGPGRPAPVMMQQTKGVQPCTPNPWPGI